MTKYFDKKLALFQEEVKDRNEVFDKLAKELFAAGLVTEDFRTKIGEREEIFPTGLNVDGFGVAIPHTDSVYVKQSQIAFMSLTHPVEFKEMGSGDLVQVQLVFMMALKEPHEQLEMLQNLISMFQKAGMLKSLKEVASQQELTKILVENNLQ